MLYATSGHVVFIYVSHIRLFNFFFLLLLKRLSTSWLLEGGGDGSSREQMVFLASWGQVSADGQCRAQVSPFASPPHLFTAEFKDQWGGTWNLKTVKEGGLDGVLKNKLFPVVKFTSWALFNTRITDFYFTWFYFLLFF